MVRVCLVENLDIPQERYCDKMFALQWFLSIVGVFLGAILSSEKTGQDKKAQVGRLSSSF